MKATDATFKAMQQQYAAGRYDEAARLGWELLKADPREPAWLQMLALAEHRQGNHPAAIVLLKRSLRSQPDGAPQWNDLGNVYSAIGDITLAEKAYRKAMELAPACAEPYNNLGVMAGEREEYAEARRFYEKALALRPQYGEATYNLGIALAAMGKFRKAAHRYEQTLALLPDHPRARFNLSLTRLLLGDLAGGWKEWESRWLTPQLAPALRTYPQPAWRGEPLAGKRILLYAEQGLGDTLQFVRYVPMVAARGATIVLEVQTPLLSLFAPLFPDWVRQAGAENNAVREDCMVSPGDELPPFDTHCSLMSLPAVFQASLSTIPFAGGYLRNARPAADEAKNDACENELRRDGLRVGIVWAGSPTHKRDHARSVPLSVFRPLLDLPHLRLVSLQKGPAASQLTELATEDAAFARIEDVASGFKNYADTAAAVDALDLVISVDTSVAHLAGAMGKPVWILLQQQLPDWRWLLERKDSPWYRSARLFRQKRAGTWEDVVMDISHGVSKWIDDRRRTQAGGLAKAPGSARDAAGGPAWQAGRG